jgi:hypothetical protein
VNLQTESHEHKSPQCKPADEGKISQEDVFECVHETQRA